MILSIENTSREVATITAYGDGFVVSPPAEDDHDGIKVYTCPPCDVVSVESVNRTIYVETTGDDTLGDGLSVETAFATAYRAVQDVKSILRAKILIQFGIGDFEWKENITHLIAELRIDAHTTLGKLTFQGTYHLVETGLVMTKGANEEHFTWTHNEAKGWTDDQYIGRHLCLGSAAKNGQPIAKSGDNWVIATYDIGPFDAIKEFQTNLIVEKAAMTKIATKQSGGTILFTQFSMTFDDNQSMNYTLSTVKYANCSWYFTEDTDTGLNFGNTTNTKHDIVRTYIEVNLPATINWSAVLDVAYGNLDNVVLNNIATLTYGLSCGLNIQGGQETINYMIVRNFPHGFQLKEGGEVRMSEGAKLMALDCGSAIRFYEGGGKIGIFHPCRFVVNNCDYLISSRSYEHIVCLLGLSLVGSPNVQAIQPTNALWNGLSLGVCQIAQDQASDPDKYIFISYP